MRRMLTASAIALLVLSFHTTTKAMQEKPGAPNTTARDRAVRFTADAVSVSESLLYAGRLDDGIALASAVLRACDRTPELPAASRADLLVARGKLLAFRSFTENAGYEDALDSLDEAVRAAKKAKNSALLASALTWKGFATYSRTFNTGAGEYQSALDLIERGLKLREAAGDTRGVAESLVYKGILLERMKDEAAAKVCYERSRSVAADGGHDLELSYALRHLAFLRQAGGDLPGALAYFRESLALRERIGFRIYLHFSHLSVGDVLLEAGDATAAMKHFAEALRLAEQLGAKRVAVLSHLAFGNAYERLGDADAAKTSFERALAVSREIGYASGAQRAMAAIERVNKANP